jgi:hypothetical protein
VTEPRPEEALRDYRGTPAQLTLELLTPSADEDRAVLVHVLNVAREPIPGAMVVVRQGSAVLFRERTADNGAALFEPYPAEKGPFRIDAVAHGYVAGTAPSVAAGVDTEIVLEARSIVTGEVTAPTFEGGIVRLINGERQHTRKLEEEGTFRFDDLDPGYTSVSVEVEPYGADKETFDLEAGRAVHLRLVVRERGRIPIQGEVSFWPGKGSMWINGRPVAVGTTGRYTFDAAVNGLNEALIDAPGKAPLRERFKVETTGMHRYDFRLHKEADVSGIVRSAATGKAIPNAEVRTGYDLGDPRNDRVPLFPVRLVPVVRTDAGGRFRIPRLDGRMIYLLSVVAEGYGQFLGEAVPDGRVRVALPEGPFVYGKLRGSGGLPGGAVVSTVPLDVQPATRYFNVPSIDHLSTERRDNGFYGLRGSLLRRPWSTSRSPTRSRAASRC